MKRFLTVFLTLAIILAAFSTAFASEAAPEADSLTAGLQVWYKFDETCGNVAKDASGNGHDATVYGAKWLTTADNVGVALELDNTAETGKYVEVPTAVMSNVPGDFTVSTWVKVEEAGTWARIFDYGTSTSNVMFMTASKYYFRMDNHADKIILPPKNSWKPDTEGYPGGYLYPEEYAVPRWQHITVTRKGNTTSLWINGIRWATKDYTTEKPRTADNYKFYIGKSVWAADPYASLEIKDFRIYNRSLSIDEIHAVMDSGEWTDKVQVQHAIDTIPLADFSGVTENLYLPVIVNDKVKVEWTSSDRDVVEANKYVGVIHRPAAGENAATAKLTATFTCGEYSESVAYDVTVLPVSADETTPTLTVDAKNVLHAMSPTMYGLFFEDISHAGDGGLYPELLRNTCFHDATASIPYWHLYTSDGARGVMSLHTENTLNDAQFQHLKLTVSEMPGEGYVGIRNEGYYGMKLEEGCKYTLTFFARSEDFSGSVSAKLLSATGEEISAPATVEGVTSDWTKYSLTLTPNAYAAQGQMVLYCEGDTGSIYFDVVSLMPKAVYGTSGLRTDMAESMKAVTPTFLRFPGGCYIEGKYFYQAFYWKTTLYNKEDRAGHENVWGYRVTDGLGYYEFLLLCEDLGCEPLYVCGTGIAHNETEDWNFWIRDTLDAIEFANGDVTTKWGKVRAEMGHPEPFGLKYVEIGNEANFQMERYEERYQDFYDAIKAVYPYMNLIADCDMENKSIDTVDLHHYNEPDWFIDNAYLFDGYTRGLYNIYVGEYAAVRFQGLQNLHAAVGEAAYMIGMERNSDLVTMATYAPLFANPNHQKWSSSGSFFDSSRLYATPSYYVQKMFANHVGDDVLEAKLSTGDGSAENANAISGSVGLCTWNTNVTYSDIKVTSNADGSVLFDGNTASLDDWTSSKGTWTVEDGKVSQTQIATDCRLWVDGLDVTDYTYEVTARKNSGNEAFIILVGAKDTDNVFFINLGGWSNTKSTVQRIKDGVKAAVTNSVEGAFETGRDYRIKVVVSENKMTVYVDGVLMFDYTQNDAVDCPLYYVAQKDNATGDIIIKGVNVSDSDYTVNVRLENAVDVGATAEAVIMTARNKYEENSFDNPENVAPVTVPVTDVSDDFPYTFMRNSVTVLVIPTGDKTANKAVLRETVEAERAEPLTESDFSDGTWAAYAAALANAEDVLENGGATQTAVNDAAEQLLGAKALLYRDHFSLRETLEALRSYINGEYERRFDRNNDGALSLLDVLTILKQLAES